MGKSRAFFFCLCVCEGICGDEGVEVSISRRAGAHTCHVTQCASAEGSGMPRGVMYGIPCTVPYSTFCRPKCGGVQYGIAAHDADILSAGLCSSGAEKAAKKGGMARKHRERATNKRWVGSPLSPSGRRKVCQGKRRGSPESLSRGGVAYLRAQRERVVRYDTTGSSITY